MKRISFALIAAFVMVFAGCIDYQETLVLKEDGSGTIKFHYGFDKEVAQKLDSLSMNLSETPMEGGGMAEDVWSREEIESELNDKHPGVKLVDYRESEDDQWKITELEFSFKSLSDFEAFSTVMDSTKGEGDESVLDRSFVKQPDGTWLFTHRLMNSDESEEMTAPQFDMSDFDMPEMGDSSNDEPAEESSHDESEEMDDSDDTSGFGEGFEGFDKAMSGFAEGMGSLMSSVGKAKVRISVTFPGEIIETNATSTEGNTAVWEFSGMELMNVGTREMTAKIK